MRKIFHKHLASVMQDAKSGEVKNTVAYSCLMNFYISHIPSAESTRLLVAFAKALISEDLEDAP